jgi:sec-independent protein translocase protein TatC
LNAVLGVLIVVLGVLSFANYSIDYVYKPLMATLPEGGQMIATDVASSFFAPFKLTMVLSIFIAMPFILYQVWAFIAPGLYKKEKRLVLPLMFGSTMLFYGGIEVVYYVVFPILSAVFTSVAPEGDNIATEISIYFDFVIKLFFAFGIVFEIPIVIILMCWTGFTDPASLRTKRPYVVVGAFVLGMLLTPPDIISQTMLAVPMLILFELGVFIASVYQKKDDTEED